MRRFGLAPVYAPLLSGGAPLTTIARQGEIEEVPDKASRRARAKSAPMNRETTKKAEVIAMMKRAKGVKLAEIMETTGWQAHSVASRSLLEER